MRFQALAVADCHLVVPEPIGDHRGFFARIFDADAFRAQGLASSFVQVNNSRSASAGTLRGLHYQTAPAGEVKLVRCVAGAAYDVVLDLRDGSATYGHWCGAELTADNRHMMYVPRGCAHGFLTLQPDTELLYLADAGYAGGNERVVRWDDPRFAIAWPRLPTTLSDKDRDARDFDPAWHRSGY